MQQLQLGQAGRLVPIMARIAEARGEIHVAQQLHAVKTGVRIAECNLGFEQFRRPAAQLLEEAHRALALADDQQPAETCAADTIAVDGVEAQGPAAVAARRWRDGLFHAADLGRNPGGLQPGHPHLALEQGQHRQTSAGAVGVQHVDRVVHMAAHVHVPGDDMAWQHGNGRPSGHHELVRLAVGDLVKQRCVEEDVAGQQVQQVDAQQDAGRNTPPSKPVRDMRGNRGHLLL